MKCVYCAVRTGSLYTILHSAHAVYLCVVCVDLRTKKNLYPYSINWPVFITETVCVYCAVRAGSLDTIHKTWENKMIPKFKKKRYHSRIWGDWNKEKKRMQVCQNTHPPPPKKISADVTGLYTSWKTSDLLVLGKEISCKRKKYINRIPSVLYSLRAEKKNLIKLLWLKLKEREREREKEASKEYNTFKVDFRLSLCRLFLRSLFLILESEWAMEFNQEITNEAT